MTSANMTAAEDWIDRDAALAMLGVRPQTLYAYVSRRLVRARADAANPRRSQYSGHDLLALVARKRGSRRRVDIATGAIAWGEPVLESAISTVRHGRLIFRGQDAAAFAVRATLEDAARLLWRTEPGATFEAAPVRRLPRAASARARGFLYLAGIAAVAPPSFGRSAMLLRADAATLLSGFADAMAGASGTGPVHARLATIWRLERHGADLVRRALVLVSDHELNASTFAVRVAASTGASLAAATLAGFSALSGPLHGQASARSLELLDRLMAVRDRRGALRAAMARGEPMLGFGHPLYPLGDVRAVELFRTMRAPAAIARPLRIAEEEIGAPPNVDMALAAMTRAFRLPDEAPFIVFAIGRMAGWLAHAMEQRETGRLIRPRARYVGE